MNNRLYGTAKTIFLAGILGTIAYAQSPDLNKDKTKTIEQGPKK